MPFQVSTTRQDNRAAFAESGRRILAALPEEEYQRIAAYVRSVPLTSKQVLLNQGEPVRQVVFLNSGACSLTRVMENGSAVEVLAIGPGAIIGVSVAFGENESFGEVFVQIGSPVADVLPTDIFKAEFERRGALWTYARRYHAALTTQLAQAVACNALHSAEQRCSRWLLTMQDHVQRDEFPVTHEMMAAALGLRRPTVTLVMTTLAEAGTIRHGRGWVAVADRQALEGMACECHRIMAESMRPLLTSPPPSFGTV